MAQATAGGRLQRRVQTLDEVSRGDRQPQQLAIWATTRPARRRGIARDGPTPSRRSTVAGQSNGIATTGRRPHSIAIPTHAAEADTMPARSGANTRRWASCS
jgi:hypothetical protein